jgi:hypothetical protein
MITDTWLVSQSQLVDSKSATPVLYQRLLWAGSSLAWLLQFLLLFHLQGISAAPSWWEWDFLWFPGRGWQTEKSNASSVRISTARVCSSWPASFLLYIKNHLQVAQCLLIARYLTAQLCAHLSRSTDEAVQHFEGSVDYVGPWCTDPDIMDHGAGVDR